MPSCLCAFDIDDTLTCPKSNEAVEACKQLDCDLAIVTARPAPSFQRVAHDVAAQFINEDAPYRFLPDPAQALRNHNTGSLTDAIALTKAQQLREIRNHDIVLFFDDVQENVLAARGAGVTAMHVDKCDIDRTSVFESYNTAAMPYTQSCRYPL